MGSGTYSVGWQINAAGSSSDDGVIPPTIIGSERVLVSMVMYLGLFRGVLGLAAVMVLPVGLYSLYLGRAAAVE